MYVDLHALYPKIIGPPDCPRARARRPLFAEWDNSLNPHPHFKSDTKVPVGLNALSLLQYVGSFADTSDYIESVACGSTGRTYHMSQPTW